jgi:hypothetical protein
MNNPNLNKPYVSKPCKFITAATVIFNAAQAPKSGHGLSVTKWKVCVCILEKCNFCLIHELVFFFSSCIKTLNIYA